VNATPKNAVVEFLQKDGSLGILLDTNILLMYIVGRHDPTCIEKFKRTNTFTVKDYTFLREFLLHFREVIATPHILTEVSNLAAHLNEPNKASCFESFAADIQTFDEHTVAASSIAATSTFKRLGITDASLPLIARDRFLVLTDDLVLYAELLKSGVDAINFNHIRLLGWAT